MNAEKKYGRVAKHIFTHFYFAAKVFIEVNYHFSLQAMHRQGDHYIIFCCCEFILFLKSANFQNSLLYRGSQALLLFFLKNEHVLLYL